MNDTQLDDDHPLACINDQLIGLLEGVGAPDDHEDVLTFLRSTGLPEVTVRRLHRAISCAEVKPRFKHPRDTLVEADIQVHGYRVLGETPFGELARNAVAKHREECRKRIVAAQRMKEEAEKDLAYIEEKWASARKMQARKERGCKL